MSEFTVKYQEGQVKGFTSFFSFLPDWMGGMNNKFYSVKDGQLYLHDDANNPIRNNFYGVQYTSDIKLVVNKKPSNIKVAKTISIEGNKALDVTIRGYLNDETSSITESTVTAAEFLNKEGIQYAYIRRNELTGDLTAKSTYGLGTLTTTTASTSLVMNTDIPTSLISVGDSVYNESNTLLGVIVSYDTDTKTIVIDAPATESAGTFIYGVKEGRIEGSEIRGYNFEIDLVDNTTSRTELFAVNTGTFDSSPTLGK
jgi:hypothetical protein